MNSFKIALIAGLLVTMAFLLPARAQHVYLGMYWIAGSVSAPAGVATANRQVIFYRDNPDNGYADDIVGTAGLSGRDNQFMLNAYQDSRLAIAPGKYHLAVVRGEDGYGADPVELSVTGLGYDVLAANLVLAPSTGVTTIAARPEPQPGEPGGPAIVGAPPIFTDITFGNRKYQPGLVARGQAYVIAQQPRITARATSAFGIDTSQLLMVLNEGKADARTFNIAAANITQSSGPTSAPTGVSFVYDFYQEKEPRLPEGQQNITFRATNIYGPTYEVCTVTVAGGEPRLIGVPLAFPSPVKLTTDREVVLQYTLSQDLNIEISLFDVSGRVVKKFSFEARAEGAAAGVNKVIWDLKTDQGGIVSSGIYVFTIVDRTNNKLLGKGKLTCLP